MVENMTMRVVTGIKLGSRAEKHGVDVWGLGWSIWRGSDPGREGEVGGS